ncbi:hypothetical protein CRI93_07050 [Longimonas halophila]|uniref:Peptidase n=1 Tax=Longimonas halophila TaxID=1469170 RepID=A0A2H3NMH8_9BACT|nr:PepSY-associated TM helix domain-containing protein [Longimonas halophila]PEN07734.1 hypothetical protein CRI93_07050 [Longimonas halophila]
MSGLGNWRKTLFRLHGWMGLNLGLLLFVICLSGTVATLSYEIDGWINPDQQVEPRDAPIDWTAMHDTVAEAFPDGQNLGVYAPGSAYLSFQHAAAVSYVSLPTGETRKVYLDPYTGALQGSTSFFNTQRFFRTFHRRLFDGNRGIFLVTLMSLPMLLSALTGWLFYKGWLKQMVTLRWNRGPRLRWSDLHKGAGIWGLLFALIIALTGIFYFAELMVLANERYDILQPEPLPQVDKATLPDFGPHPELLPAGEYVAAAQAAFPDLTVHTVRMPHTPSDAVYIDGQAGNPLTRDRASKVHVHPFTGEVLGVQRSGDLGPAAFITDMADPLHFGYFAGFGGKVAWTVFGLVLSFSILSGTYLWMVRSRPRSHIKKEAQNADPSGWGPMPMLRGAIGAAALTLAYFVIVSIGTVTGIQDRAPERGPEIEAGTLQAGPFRVDMRCQAPCRGDEATVTARFRSAGMPNVRDISVVDTESTAIPMSGAARAPQAEISAAPGDSLRLRLTTHDDNVYTAGFAMPAAQESARSASPWPDTPSGVWWVIGAFVVVTAGSILVWLWMVMRAFQFERQRQIAKAQRAAQPSPPPGATLPPGAS